MEEKFLDAFTEVNPNVQTSVFDFEAKDIRGQSRSLSDFKGKVLLVVNVASRCGFSPQYKDLQRVYEKYKDRGFEVLGFPCNQFGDQEPDSESEIMQACELNFGVSFPMFSKVDVNGEKAHPLFQFLKAEAKGIFGSEAIKWNFTKFLVGRDGKVFNRYASTTVPEKISPDIEQLL